MTTSHVQPVKVDNECFSLLSSRYHHGKRISFITLAPIFLILGLAFTYLQSSHIHSTLPDLTTSSFDSLSEPKYSSIFYLKTHKTGSTTIKYHLLNYMNRHKLQSISAPGHIFISSMNPKPRVRADGIVAHHMVFNRTVYESYLRQAPELILSSIRLPLQRQVSWFRQQNNQFEDMDIENCTLGQNLTLLNYYDKWRKTKKIGAQWMTMREAEAKENLGMDVEKILNQFDFVFVREHMKESFECFCALKRVNLCNGSELGNRNTKHTGSCVEQQLLKYRSNVLMSGDELDLLLYEAAVRRLRDCGNISEECRCSAH